MYRSKLFFLLALVMLLTLAFTVQAQEASPTPTPVNPNANISWPPAVYVLRGEFTVRGSANLPNMQTYFLEFRPLNPDLTPADDAVLWFPVTVPQQQAVQDDILGVWDTTTVEDGVYELRLSINMPNNLQQFFVVAPLRIENNPPPFAVTPVGVPTQAVPTQGVVVPQVTATPTFDPSPRATARLNANVRRGDSVIYEAFAGLQAGQTAPIVGRSSLGTGWFLVQLPDGRQGWVSPSVVDVSGELNNVPFVEPPPPPTPTPIPATATPSATVNLVAGNFRFDPTTPTCAQTFNIFLDVANFGSTASPSGLISVQDFRSVDNTMQGNTLGAVPSINPGQTVSVGPIPITISTFYDEQHRLVISIDPGNQIIETNKSDNSINALYTLAKGSCP